MIASKRSLRAKLRGATATAHGRLDAAMREAAGWSEQGDYARFLSLQYAARCPVEQWLDRFAAPHLLPPAQTPLIASDLAAMGYCLPSPAPPVALYPTGEFSVLGVAWVLAGSALGNRAILKEVQRACAASGGPSWSQCFLGDGAMFDFWHALRGTIECPASDDDAACATQAANAIFDHFHAAAQGSAHVQPPAKAQAA